MTNKDKNTLEHISMRCDRVSEDIARFGNSYEIFDNDHAFCDSVSMNLLQIGELTQSLSNEFKERTDHIPWKQIYDMRCRFAHGYGVMAKAEIWDTAINDVPVLKEFCERQLEEFERKAPGETEE